jgi:hypothetical protein
MGAMRPIVLAMLLAAAGIGFPHDGVMAQQNIPRSAALEAANAEIRAAQAAVEEARRRLQAGEEPLPGERTGIVGGNTRLNEDYFRRQEALKLDLLRAQQRLERAHDARNNLRD